MLNMLGNENYLPLPKPERHGLGMQVRERETSRKGDDRRLLKVTDAKFESVRKRRKEANKASRQKLFSISNDIRLIFWRRP